MAEALILSRRLLAALSLCATMVGAHAQSLQDPTRPVQAASEGGDGMANIGPQLESVLITHRRGGRNLAVIDGETVHQGDLYKGARVARITHKSVELVRGKDKEVLQMSTADEASVGVKRLARLQ